MITRVSRAGLLSLIAFALFAVVTTLAILPRTGGPSILPSHTYSVYATFADTQGLISNGKVLDRGVELGRVGKVEMRGSRARLELKIKDRYAPLYRDASARIGQRTVIGDAYVDLRRGTPGAGPLPENGDITKILPTVEFDEAYSTFDPATRKHAAALLNTFGRSAASHRSPQQWGATVTQLGRVAHEVRGLAGELRGQEQDIVGLVQGSRAAFHELGSRERALASLVANARRTFAVFAARPADFGAGLRELPRLLRTARSTLNHGRPLLVEARPLVADLRAASPELQATFRDLRPTAADARQVTDGLTRFNHAALPFLRDALAAVVSGQPFAHNLSPALQNLVPIVRYASPRAPELAAWFSNTLGASLSHDSKGPWARLQFFAEPGTAFGLPAGTPGTFSNRATSREPGDARSPQPQKPFPLLMPFRP